MLTGQSALRFGLCRLMGARSRRRCRSVESEPRCCQSESAPVSPDEILGRFCAGRYQGQKEPLIVEEVIYHWRKASVLGMQRPSLLPKRNVVDVDFRTVSGN